MLGRWLLEDRDSAKILEMRDEMMALVGCWADVHFGGVPSEEATESQGGRWLVVDDTGGLLVASMAERMGILHPKPEEENAEGKQPDDASAPIDMEAINLTEEPQQDQPETTETTNPSSPKVQTAEEATPTTK
ncbi:hypothetical protein NM208_g16284 [Fusarium decemcellulare]|uniref:Uncharacterized protein n=1 Tax=Fusarium decemcellulare TaxID=57161 RepID=A0ACC1RDA6_9HYPO|nr:hypothetical protein NM208_g16284 [Fusarium decemcellulare]